MIRTRPDAKMARLSHRRLRNMATALVSEICQCDVWPAVRDRGFENLTDNNYLRHSKREVGGSKGRGRPPARTVTGYRSALREFPALALGAVGR
jgi:hypothetical protein